MSGQIVTYACGSPIRQKLMYSIAKGFDSDLFNPFPGPDYLGGTAIVWGLIRGARELMEKAADSEEDFYQIDNGYFGRNQYFRISKNALQKTQITVASKTRSAQVLENCGITLPKGVTGKKGSKILVALSSENLYAFHGQTSRQWLISTIESITQFSDREIEIRSKNSSKPLAQDLDEAWCVVTHSSAVALDALQRNIPVICTSRCAASPLSMRFSDIESPKIDGSVEELFLSLAESQFTQEEYKNGLAREILGSVNHALQPPNGSSQLQKLCENSFKVEKNASDTTRYPFQPTQFKSSAYQESFSLRDFFFCADGDGEYPEHHCKLTWNIAKSHLYRYRNAIDIGCRDGEFTRYLSSAYEMTYCFDPRIMQRFADNVDLKKVCHFGCALGDTNTRIEMSGGQHNLLVGKRYFVDCFKLDEFNINNVDLIKIDVEGYEERVILGALNTIENYRPIIIIEQNHITLAGEPKFKALALLKSLGYRESAVDPRGWDFVMTPD